MLIEDTYPSTELCDSFCYPVLHGLCLKQMVAVHGLQEVVAEAAEQAGVLGAVDADGAADVMEVNKTCLSTVMLAVALADVA